MSEFKAGEKVQYDEEGAIVEVLFVGKSRLFVMDGDGNEWSESKNAFSPYHPPQKVKLVSPFLYRDNGRPCITPELYSEKDGTLFGNWPLRVVIKGKLHHPEYDDGILGRPAYDEEIEVRGDLFIEVEG